jgi:hypothetical protein
MNEREARRISAARHEEIFTHDDVHKTIRSLREQNAALLAALRLCLPVMEVEAKTSHFLQGFARRDTEVDRILARVNRVIGEAEKGELR